MSWRLPWPRWRAGGAGLRDLSLHILDLIENSIAAGATIIRVSIEQRLRGDEMVIAVEDNGHGLSVLPDKAMDPFFTTKSGKHTGLGLSLLKAAAERAGGALSLSRSKLGGLAVEAVMQIHHVDRSPLGDIATTISSMACTNPEIDLRCRFCSEDS
jgi:signal transduction histidine kinase